MNTKQAEVIRADPATFDAYAAMDAGEAIKPYQYTPQNPGPMDVEVEITHCGICHTDLHLIHNDFGISSYPLVPGHEIVGTIASVGSSVAGLSVGQRVGVGWLAGADFTCDDCVAGHDNLCAAAQPTCVGREGGFATRIRIDGRHAFPIPDALPSEYAAPLLCAGVTVFTPLQRHNVSGTTRLGVIGIGGLGHLALQYGRALGCHVTAFSASPEKADEAKAFGADAFVDTRADGAMEACANSCDFLLSTVPSGQPWNDWLGVLRAGGKFCILGVPDAELQINPLPLIMGQKSIITSLVGSRAEVRAMLAFSARHKITPKIEQFPMSEVNTALDRLRNNQLRYRAVLCNA